jgi:hypothetical protein
MSGRACPLQSPRAGFRGRASRQHIVQQKNTLSRHCVLIGNFEGAQHIAAPGPGDDQIPLAGGGTAADQREALVCQIQSRTSRR